MKAKLIHRTGPGKSDIQIQNMQIFDDCTECESKRKKDMSGLVWLKGQCHRVSNIICSCKKVTAHQDLIIETELIDFFTSAGIKTVDVII